MVSFHGSSINEDVGWSVSFCIFSAYETFNVSKLNIIIWEGHGSTREGDHGRIKEVIFSIDIFQNFNFMNI